MARGRRLSPPPRCGNSAHRMTWYCHLALLVTLLLAGPPATGGARAKHHRARHRHLERGSEMSTGDNGEESDRSEPEKLDTTVSVGNEELQLEAWKPTCGRYWAYRQAESFGCRRVALYPGPSPQKGVSLDNATWVESFMVAVSVYKEDRLTGQLNSLTNCTGWLLDQDLVLTYAECVGPRSEWEVPTRIRVHQMRVPASSPTGSWAARTCWSSKMRWPGFQRASYELAVVRLAKPLGILNDPKKPEIHKPEPVCLTRPESDGGIPPPPQKGPCAVVSVCDPINGLAPAMKVTPVRRVRDEKRCREGYVGGQVGGAKVPGPRHMACWESTSEPQVNLQRKLCPVESSRAVYCWPSGCPERTSPDGPQAHLLGLGPMSFRAGKERVLYQPAEAPGTPAGVTSMADLDKNHEQLKDMLVDARLHTHGGSGRSICRNLLTSDLDPAGTGAGPQAYALDLRVSNMGYKPARPGEIDEGQRQVRRLSVQDLPMGAPDAMLCSRCWSAGGAKYLSEVHFDCKGRNDCRESELARMPFLLELRVRKRFTQWAPGRGGPSIEHEHTCEAWLVDRNTALAHAECVGPETNFDRIEGVTVRLPGGTVNASAPIEREATVACWAREAAPYHWNRGLELAAVRFEPPVEYKENVLQPACLQPPGAPKGQGPSECALVAPCSDGLQQQQQRRQQQRLQQRQRQRKRPQWSNQTSTTAVAAHLLPCKYTLSNLPIDWLNPEYHASRLGCPVSYYDRRKPLCAGTAGPPEDQSRMILCKSACPRPKDNQGAHLAYVRTAIVPPDHPQIRYQEPANYPMVPQKDWTTMLLLDLSRAQRQLLELLLALHADGTGTLDAVCQRLHPAKSRGGGGGGRRRHSKQSAARRRHRVG